MVIVSGNSGTGKTTAMQFFVQSPLKFGGKMHSPFVCRLVVRDLKTFELCLSSLRNLLGVEDLTPAASGCDFYFVSARFCCSLNSREVVKSLTVHVGGSPEPTLAQSLDLRACLQKLKIFLDSLMKQNAAIDRSFAPDEPFVHPIIWVEDIHSCSEQFAAALLREFVEMGFYSVYPIIMTTSEYDKQRLASLQKGLLFVSGCCFQTLCSK